MNALAKILYTIKQHPISYIRLKKKSGVPVNTLRERIGYIRAYKLIKVNNGLMSLTAKGRFVLTQEMRKTHNMDAYVVYKPLIAVEFNIEGEWVLLANKPCTIIYSNNLNDAHNLAKRLYGRDYRLKGVGEQ